MIELKTTQAIGNIPNAAPYTVDATASGAGIPNMPLPMTLLMRPLNVETLATSIYQYATRGSFEEGALAALLIVAAGIVPVIMLVRLADVTETTSLSGVALTGSAAA